MTRRAGLARGGNEEPAAISSAFTIGDARPAPPQCLAGTTSHQPPEEAQLGIAIGLESAVKLEMLVAQCW